MLDFEFLSVRSLAFWDVGVKFLMDGRKEGPTLWDVQRQIPSLVIFATQLRGIQVFGIPTMASFAQSMTIPLYFDLYYNMRNNVCAGVKL